jgi:UDP-3-O-[3-hydroxymyristoyl] N-acetylglucosamine deacetylase / 3-hydroxyacyl-[acyl-carrier-protein] dehydratase
MKQDLQTTIARSATVSGLGLFSGGPVNVTFRPAPANKGIVFIRTDQERAEIPALVRHVVKRARRTAIKVGDVSIETTEHVLAAIAGLGIDNVLIEMDRTELPGFDGSAKPFVDALLSAGIETLEVPKTRLIIQDPVVVRQDDAMVAAVPSEDPGLQLVYDLDYGRHPVLGHQLAAFDFTRGDFTKDIAPARTFVLEAEAKALRAMGLGQHLSEKDILVIDNKGPQGGNAFHFTNEPARHKLLDLLGDLTLLGAPIQGKIIATKSGHWLNQALVRKLEKQLRAQRHKQLSLGAAVLDIRKLMRILPHRYPMLLVDRVVELDGDRRVLGIKNVTSNEPFFQGHYPGAPIMPGVLIVEALAQLSGVLLGQKLENTGKLAVLLSLDNVKLRRPVTPGDQLILESEAVRIRSKLAHCRCRAYVGQDLAAECEVKFMLVDDQSE